MSARNEFEALAQLADYHEKFGTPPWISCSDINIEASEAIALIDALRARVVVAEEALVVAHEDADRLARELSCPVPMPDSRALAAHRVAVSSRPKATQ